MENRKIILVGAIFAWFFISGTAFSANRINGYFLLGTNLAWFDGNYGHDLGASHPEKWKPGFSEETCRNYFRDISALGYRVLRVWAFERQQGLLFDSEDKMVTALSPELLKNCDVLMKVAAENRIFIYWTMLNHLIVEDEGGKHMNIIFDEKVRQSYIKNALIPFVKRYASHPAFFAVDLLNEAEGAIGKSDALTGAYKPWRGVTWWTMRGFIKTCTSSLHSAIPGVKVSSTSGWHEHKNLGRYKDLGLDFLDWHSYHDSGELPNVKDLKIGDLPCILGECGPEKKTRDDALQERNWKKYIEQAYSKGYAGVLTWSYGTAGDDNNFSVLNKDRSWRPAAKVSTEFTWKNHDVGPTMFDAWNKSILNAVSSALSPILAVGPGSDQRSSWYKLYRSLQNGAPYRNPDYALAKFDEACSALYKSYQSLMKRKSQGDSSQQVAQGIENIRKLAKRVVDAIAKSSNPGRDKVLSRASAKTFLLGIVEMPGNISNLFQPPVKIKRESSYDKVKGISSNPFNDE